MLPPHWSAYSLCSVKLFPFVPLSTGLTLHTSCLRTAGCSTNYCTLNIRCRHQRRGNKSLCFADIQKEWPYEAYLAPNSCHEIWGMRARVCRVYRRLCCNWWPWSPEQDRHNSKICGKGGLSPGVNAYYLKKTTKKTPYLVILFFQNSLYCYFKIATFQLSLLRSGITREGAWD